MSFALSGIGLLGAAWLLAWYIDRSAPAGSFQVWRRAMIVLLAGFGGAVVGVGIVWILWLSLGQPAGDAWPLSSLAGIALGSSAGSWLSWRWLAGRRALADS
jgi:hypothetical protein